MEELATIAEVRSRLATERAQGRRIGLVPTMGSLHAGHLSLVNAARRASDCVVMSVFVNPLQFAPGEDFERYPRDLERDRTLARDRGVDVLFTPTAAEMYGAGTQFRVHCGDIGTRLEGAVRPGHFDGVLTVVAKLINIVTPDVACFGQKDIQQFVLVQRMIDEFNFPVSLVRAPTLREPDGLAMSSRNIYLSPAERVSARALSQALVTIDAAWIGGETDARVLRARGVEVLTAADGVAPDYLLLVDPGQLEPVAQAVAGTVVVVAARVGKTRLIDNLILGA